MIYPIEMNKNSLESSIKDENLLKCRDFSIRLERININNVDYDDDKENKAKKSSKKEKRNVSIKKLDMKRMTDERPEDVKTSAKRKRIDLQKKIQSDAVEIQTIKKVTKHKEEISKVVEKKRKCVKIKESIQIDQPLSLQIPTDQNIVVKLDERNKIKHKRVQPSRKVKCGSNIEKNKSTSDQTKNDTGKKKENDVPMNEETKAEIFSIAINKPISTNPRSHSMAINEEDHEFRQEIYTITSKRKRIEYEAEKNDDVVEKQSIKKTKNKEKKQKNIEKGISIVKPIESFIQKPLPSSHIHKDQRVDTRREKEKVTGNERLQHKRSSGAITGKKNTTKKKSRVKGMHLAEKIQNEAPINDYLKDEIVLATIPGYAPWPARILDIICETIIVEFFGTGQINPVRVTAISRFEIRKVIPLLKRRGYNKAIRELELVLEIPSEESLL